MTADGPPQPTEDGATPTRHAGAYSATLIPRREQHPGPRTRVDHSCEVAICATGSGVAISACGAPSPAARVRSPAAWRFACTGKSSMLSRRTVAFEQRRPAWSRLARRVPERPSGHSCDRWRPLHEAVRAAAPSHVATVRRHFIALLTPEQGDVPVAVARRVRASVRPEGTIRRTACDKSAS